MNPRLWLLTALFFISIAAFGQAPKTLAKGDRPVFMNAQRLAMLCGDWNALNPSGHPPKRDDDLQVSPVQIAHSMACDAYILGVFDQQMEPASGPNYHPISSAMTEMKPLVDTFLKYVGDHPEKQDFAASTLLWEAVKIATNAQKPTH